MTDLDALANEYIDKHLYGGNKRTHLVALLEKVREEGREAALEAINGRSDKSIATVGSHPRGRGAVMSDAREIERLRAALDIATAALRKMARDGCGCVTTDHTQPCHETRVPEDWCWSCEAIQTLEALNGGKP